MLLTGASGLIGTWLRRLAPSGVDVVSLVHRRELAEAGAIRCDLRDPEAVSRLFDRVRPSLVIHAAYAMDETSIVDSTRHVVDAAEKVGAAVVHISTDVVFSGDGSSRSEGSPPDPIADYGRWKAEAERIVARGSERHVIVRLPLVVSVDPEDQGLRRILNGASAREPTTWFTDEVRQPALASDLAAALWRIAGRDPAVRRGVWHLPGPEKMTRHELARRMVQAFGIDEHWIVAAETPVDLVRPRHIDLGATRAIREVGWAPDPVLP